MPLFLKATCLCMLFASSIVHVFAFQTSSANVEQDMQWANSPTSSLIERAESLRFENPQQSLQIASYALVKANKENNAEQKAKVHSIIGWLSHELQNNNDAKYHYLQASRIHTELGNTESQIANAFEYIELLFVEDNHNLAYQKLDKLLPIAMQHGDNQLTSLLLMLRANSLYYQKRYNESEKAFLEAIEYLDSPDTASQTNRGEAFHQLGQIFKYLKDYDQGIRYHKMALETHSKLGSPSLIARSLKNIGLAESKKANYLVALDYTLRAIKIQEKLNEPSKHAELLVAAGSIYRNLNRYETSLEYINEALDMYREVGNVEKIADTLNQMGLLYNRLKNYDEAYALYKEAVDLPNEQIRKSTLATIYREIAVYNKRQSEYQVAMQYAHQANDMFMQLGDFDRATKTERIIGDIHLDNNENKSAIEHYSNALALAEKTNKVSNQVRINVSLGYVYKVSNINKARDYFLKALGLTKNSKFYNDKASIFRELMRIEAGQGNHEAAYNYSQKLLEVREIINEEYKASKLATAKAALEAHITKNELETLREKVKFDELAMAKQNAELEITQQANIISELELEKNKYANILLIAMLALCIAIGIYIFRIFILSKRRNVELDYLATRDPLTNCLNRRGFFDIIDKDFNNEKHPITYSIIMADVDNFKTVNDENGHEVGDKVLKHVSEILQSCIRKNDIIARYGGEEFCIAVADISIEKVQTIAEAMREKIQQASCENVSVTCSFGIASLGKSSDNPSELICKADKALYYSKAHGRNQVSLWDKSMAGTVNKS